MADTKPKPDPSPDAPTPAMRVEACAAELRGVLERHQCEIRAFLTAPEVVGTAGDRAIIGASFGVFPKG